jgi:signal peptidase I
MTEPLLNVDGFDDVVAELRDLAEQAGPSARAHPDLARTVLARARRRRLTRRAGAAATGLAVVAAVAGVAAGALHGHRGYFAEIEPSSSMRPTVAIGQTVVFSKTLTPARGDVVMIRLPLGPILGGGTVETMKRVVGLPGDTVACPAVASGRCEGVTVDGVQLNESYLDGGTEPFTAVTVPAGQVFVLGDDREVSADSRTVGPVPLAGIRGVAVRIEDGDGRAHLVPGAPSHPGPPDDGVQDLPPAVPPAQVAPAQ